MTQPTSVAVTSCDIRLQGPLRARPDVSGIVLTVDEEQIDERTAARRFDIPLPTERLVAATEWTRRQRIAGVVSRGDRPDLAGAALPQVRAATLLIVGEPGTLEQVAALAAGWFAAHVGTQEQRPVLRRPPAVVAVFLRPCLRRNTSRISRLAGKSGSGVCPVTA